MPSPLPIIYLRTAQRGISGSIRFQKLVFLGGEETNIPKQYKFVPYKFGPYSFQLFQDIESWIDSGHIDRSRNRNSYGNYRTDCTLTPKGIRTAKALLEKSGVDKLFDATQRINKEYSNESLSDLLEYVYRAYPEYTDKSTLEIERLLDESTTSQFTETDESHIGPFNHIKKESETEGEVAGMDKEYTRYKLTVGSSFEVTLERVDQDSLSIYWDSKNSSLNQFKKAVKKDDNISSDSMSEMRTKEKDGWIRGECEKLIERAERETCLFFRTQTEEENLTITWESGFENNSDEITLHTSEENVDYQTVRRALVLFATETCLNTDLKHESQIDVSDTLMNESLRQTAKFAIC